MRKLVLILIGLIAVIAFIRAYDNSQTERDLAVNSSAPFSDETNALQ